jgi:hypothetical protein
MEHQENPPIASLMARPCSVFDARSHDDDAHVLEPAARGKIAIWWFERRGVHAKRGRQ